MADSILDNETELPAPATTPDVTPKGALVLVSIADAFVALQKEWENPTPAMSTGLAPIDEQMRGGLRPGDFVAVVGAAGGGKSALVAQIALETAKAGASVIYASVEMPATEIVARWLAREAFDELDPNADVRGDLGYASILYGEHTRDAESDVLALVEGARQRLAAVADRVFVQQVTPGSTVADLRKMVDMARARARVTDGADAPDRPVVLVVDPMQRFYASDSDTGTGRTGRALEAVNASETERVGAVAQELKELADKHNVAVLATSDTTKQAAGGATSSALSLRGSYVFNHMCTLVLGLHSKETVEGLVKWLNGGPKNEKPADVPTFDAKALEDGLPAKWSGKAARKLGQRVVAVECSKNRRGKPTDFVLGGVLGAAWFGSSGNDIERLPAPSKGKTRPKTRAVGPARTGLHRIVSGDE